MSDQPDHWGCLVNALVIGAFVALSVLAFWFFMVYMLGRPWRHLGG